VSAQLGLKHLIAKWAANDAAFPPIHIATAAIRTSVQALWSPKKCRKHGAKPTDTGQPIHAAAANDGFAFLFGQSKFSRPSAAFAVHDLKKVSRLPLWRLGIAP